MKPMKGRFVHPAVPTHAMAFVESAALKEPPTYTEFVSLSQRRALTVPEMPGKGVTCCFNASYMATACASTPPRLVKLPPTTMPARAPFAMMNGHMALILASAADTSAKAPVDSGTRRDWDPFVLLL